MTKTQALDTVRALAAGLAPTLAGCSRLLERIAGHDEAEALRAALTELGAKVVLDELAR